MEFLYFMEGSFRIIEQADLEAEKCAFLVLLKVAPSLGTLFVYGPSPRRMSKLKFSPKTKPNQNKTK